MPDVFGRKSIVPKKPITADMCTIIWGGDANNGTAGAAVASATNVAIQYQQVVTRRRTLGASEGAPVAVIYPSQPLGSMSIQRLVAESAENIFSRPGWNICQGTAKLTLSFDGATVYEGCSTKGGVYTISGATVTGYSISAEAEGLTVIDGIQIEFLQMEYQHRTT